MDDLKNLTNEKLIDRYVSCRVALGFKNDEGDAEKRQANYLAARQELDRRLNPTPFDSLIKMLVMSDSKYEIDDAPKGCHYRQELPGTRTLVSVETHDVYDTPCIVECIFDSDGNLIAFGAHE